MIDNKDIEAQVITFWNPKINEYLFSEDRLLSLLPPSPPVPFWLKIVRRVKRICWKLKYSIRAGVEFWRDY